MPLDIDTTLTKLLTFAKKARAERPYTIKNGDAGIPVTVIVIGPNDEKAVVPMVWKDEREKYAKMRVVSKTAMEVFAQAVVMLSDMRWTNSDKFCDHFKLAKPTATEPGSVERFQKQYLRILNDQYGGLLMNLPRNVWSDGLVAVLKGPMVGTHARVLLYEQGPGDTVLFTGGMEKHDRDQFNLLPDWWN